MAENKCSKCGAIAETFPVNFEGHRELCLECRWKLVRIHNKIVDLSLSNTYRNIILTKFFASKFGYSNIMEELEEHGETKS